MAEQAKLKVTFKVKETLPDGGEGPEVVYAVVRPSPKVVAEGQRVYNRAFKEAIDSDAIVRAKLEAVLRRQQLWDDARQAEADKINAEIAEGEKALARGYRVEGERKVTLKLSEGKEVAVRLRRLRFQLRELLRDRTSLDALTAEAQADNKRFEFYVVKTFLYDDTGGQVFRDVEHYQEHAGEPHAFRAASELAGLLVGGMTPDWERKLPENAFLSRYRLVDDKLRLIDKDGRLVDADGRLIDEEGRYVNEAGEYVNRDGESIDKDGHYLFPDAVEFEDDLGVNGQEGPQGGGVKVPEPALVG